MGRVITIFNQKGGVGKTTTCLSLGAYLALLGEKTLIIDFDPQFNATIGLNADNDHGSTIYHLMFSETHPKEGTQPTHLFNLDVIPASSDLAGALVELPSQRDRNHYLKRVVDELRGDYDYILIDMAPSLSLLSINGLVAADEVIIPLQCEHYSLEGLNQLLQTIELVGENIGSDIKIAGALLTMHEAGDRLSEKIAREVEKKFPHYVFKTKIPRSRSLAEAPGERRPIVLFDPQSEGARAYEKLARELISQSGTHGITEERNNRGT